MQKEKNSTSNNSDFLLTHTVIEVGQSTDTISFFETQPNPTSIVIDLIRHPSLEKRCYIGGFSQHNPMPEGMPSLQFVADHIDIFLKENKILIDTGKQNKLIIFESIDGISLALPANLEFELAERIAKFVLHLFQNLTPDLFLEYFTSY